MQIQIKNTPLSLESVDDSLLTFTCTCGRAFTVTTSTLTLDVRCEVCTEISSSIPELSEREVIDLSQYIYDTVLTSYQTKFNRG
jgi:hypothetical protein